MKALLRILYCVVALVFLACTIVQFHHHDDDGCLCMHMHLHDYAALYQDCVSCHGVNLSSTHNHAGESECSLHLSDTEVSNINNIPSSSHSTTHSHTALCAVLCACLSTLNLFEPEHTSWQTIAVIGNVTAISGLCWALRAPPVA